MQFRVEKYLFWVVVTAVLLANTASSLAESDFEAISADSEPVVAVPTPSEEVNQEAFLGKLKQEFSLSKTDYSQLLNRISDTKKHLVEISEEKTDLQTQLGNLESQVALTTEKLFDAVRGVVEAENQIILLYEAIEVREVAVEYQKQLLRDYIQVIYQEENGFLHFDEEGGIDAFKMLLSDGTVGDNMKQLVYFDLLNEAGQQLVDKLDGLNNELVAYKENLESTKSQLVIFEKVLEDEKEQLDIQKAAKEKILALTLGQEKVYSQLLEQSMSQQEEMVSDIKSLANALNFIDEKVRSGESFDPDDYASLLNFRSERTLMDFDFNYSQLSDKGFSWPVQPNRGISAYFRDAGYVGVFGVQHNAIDIPTYQGSAVHAANDGVVYKAKDNGYGYSYIILAHAGGFQTVYGHISSILVEEGQAVPAGAIIGLSGGMPGTLGSGYMTTGPHLHFEMLLNGMWVDALHYLPLNILSEEIAEKLPAKYLDDYQADVLSAEAVW